MGTENRCRANYVPESKGSKTASLESRGNDVKQGKLGLLMGF